MSRKQEPLTIENLLLGLIRIEPIHAYDLHKRLCADEELKYIWHFNQSQLYATLEKIERNDLIASHIDDSGSIPVRKIYTITPIGEEAFKQWLFQPVRRNNALRSDFLAKLYFLKDYPKEQLHAVLDAQTNCCAEDLEKFQAAMDQCEEGSYLQMISRFRVEFTAAAIRWLESLY